MQAIPLSILRFVFANLFVGSAVMKLINVYSQFNIVSWKFSRSVNARNGQESIINQKKYKWSAETSSTMIENLHTFELFIIDSNDNKKKVKTEYYVYFEED